MSRKGYRDSAFGPGSKAVGSIYVIYLRCLQIPVV